MKHADKSSMTTQHAGKPSVTAQHSAAPAAPVKPANGPSVGREFGTLIIKIAVAALAAVALFTFVYGFQRNLEPGMEPAVKDGDLILFYRLDKNYAIDDLLILKFRGETQIRRVVAKAGDVVDITKDGLIINGDLQQEPDIYQKTERYQHGISFPVKVGPDQVFVLGDARADATDSRVYGPVNTKDTSGMVFGLLRRRGL